MLYPSFYDKITKNRDIIPGFPVSAAPPLFLSCPSSKLSRNFIDLRLKECYYKKYGLIKLINKKKIKEVVIL
ncbi:hypothetical protein CLOSCI_01750 [[Clostridium] scindens ATCC 35704]|nr:hypothetical protein CLOSCI_01750 [[Clostridium] scindens ATCC 35704]